jgi:uncharacterized protein
MNRSARIAVPFAVLLAASALWAIDVTKLKPTGYVNDFANVLDASGKRRLEAYCGEVERATGVQMAFVLVDTLDGDPIEDVANKLYIQWGIGKKGTNEGILVLLAVHDRKQRAEIGYGLEPIVPDGYAGGVLRGIRPLLRQGNYSGALLAAAQEFGDRIAQAKGVEIAGQPRRPAQRGRPEPEGGIPWPLLVGGFFLFMWIIGRLSGGGRSGGGRSGGSGGSGAGGLLTGLILGNIMGRSSGWGGGGGGGWGGGGFGGSGGGGGFGGFGGGDSGGGGASSDW